MSVRTAVVAKLAAALPPLTVDGKQMPRVHSGQVPVDNSGVVVTSALPYLVYFGTVGLGESEDLGSTLTKRVPSFQITYVGATDEQAEWAGEKATTALDFGFVEVDGQTVQLVPTDALYLDRDDKHTRPDGGPLFHGILRYDTYLPA